MRTEANLASVRALLIYVIYVFAITKKSLAFWLFHSLITINISICSEKLDKFLSVTTFFLSLFK